MKFFLGNLNPVNSDLFSSLAEDYGISVTSSIIKCDLRINVDPLNVRGLNPARDLVLIVEPEVVRPDLYRKNFLREYKLILPLGPYRAKRLGLKYYFKLPAVVPNYQKDNLTRRAKENE